MIACAALFTALTALADQILEDLGNFPTSQITQTGANAVSDDGSVVVGNGVDSRFNDNTQQYEHSEVGFRWEKSTGMVSLGTVEGGQGAWQAKAVSGDGQIIAGITLAPTLYLKSGQNSKVVNSMGFVGAISGDGSTLVGSEGPIPGNFWILTGLTPGAIAGAEPLVPVKLMDGAVPRAISHDGTVVAGFTGTMVFRWADEQMTTASGESGDLGASATGITSDGSLIVGTRITEGFLKRGFTWDGTGAIVDLPMGSYQQTEAKGVTGDGELIVGEAKDEFARRLAVAWKRQDNTYAAPELLGEDGTNTINNFTIATADAISRDGTVIVGKGAYSFGGANQAYRLILNAVAWGGQWQVATDGVSVDTGAFLGWIDVSGSPWVFIYALGKYAYLPEEFVTDSGSWTWLPQ
jgi:uncharacterized membrane protein